MNGQLKYIKLDLKILGQIPKIADTGYISKIEAKLPITISTDWWKVVTEEKLGNKVSREKFDQLITTPTHIKGGEQKLHFDSSCFGKKNSFLFLSDIFAIICNCFVN